MPGQPLPVLSAPVYALFSLEFYRRVIHSRISRAFLYLFYLTSLATTLVLFLFITRGLPEMGRFLDWAKHEMPELTWTPEGLVMNAASPYTMVHAELGPLVTFDMTQTGLKADAMGSVVMFVTSKTLYVRQGVNEVRTYDLTRTVTEKKGQADRMIVNITPQSLQKFYDSLKPWLVVFTLVLFFIFFFSWKCLAALFFSWVGLLINFTRRPKLNYGAVFNISIFALTPATLIQGLQALFPVTRIIPFGFFGSFLLTGLYLYFAIKKTEEKTGHPDLEAEDSGETAQGLS